MKFAGNILRKFDRDLARDEQSPQGFTAQKLKPRFESQVKKFGLEGLTGNPEVDAYFHAEPADVRYVRGDGTKSSINIHHITPVRNLDKLFAHTTPEQQKYLQSITPTGDYIQNVFLMPQIAHQGLAGVTQPIHNVLRAKGLEITPTNTEKLHPVLRQIEMAENLPFEDKVMLARDYERQVAPLIKQELDQVLNDYEDMMDGVIYDARHGTDLRSAVIREDQAAANMSNTLKRKELDRHMQQVADEDAVVDRILVELKPKYEKRIEAKERLKAYQLAKLKRQMEQAYE